MYGLFGSAQITITPGGHGSSFNVRQNGDSLSLEFTTDLPNGTDPQQVLQMLRSQIEQVSKMVMATTTGLLSQQRVIRVPPTPSDVSPKSDAKSAVPPSKSDDKSAIQQSKPVKKDTDLTPVYQYPMRFLLLHPRIQLAAAFRLRILDELPCKRTFLNLILDYAIMANDFFDKKGAMMKDCRCCSDVDLQAVIKRCVPNENQTQVQAQAKALLYHHDYQYPARFLLLHPRIQLAAAFRFRLLNEMLPCNNPSLNLIIDYAIMAEDFSDKESAMVKDCECCSDYDLEYVVSCVPKQDTKDAQAKAQAEALLNQHDNGDIYG